MVPYNNVAEATGTNVGLYILLSISNVFVYVHRTKGMMTAKHGRDGKENIGSGSG